MFAAYHDLRRKYVFYCENKKLKLMMHALKYMQNNFTSAVHKNDSNLGLIIPCDPSGVIASRGDEAMIRVAADFLRAKSLIPCVLTQNKISDKELQAQGIQPYLETDELFSENSIKRIVQRFSSVCVLGADVIDGHYSVIVAARQLGCFALFSKLQMDVRLFGFSFNQNPDTRIKPFFKAVPDNKRFLLRDEISLKRLQKFLPDIADRCDITADVAFLLKPRCSEEAKMYSDWIRTHKSQGKTVLGINLHAMYSCTVTMENKIKWVSTVADALNILFSEDENLSLLGIPHDNHFGLNNDCECLRVLYQNIKREYWKRINIIPAVLHPGEIKEIVGGCDGVITGRMHLAIAALGRQVPVFCFAYQGKFDGLYKHFSLNDDYVVSPADIVDVILLKNKIKSFIMQIEEEKSKISQKLPLVIKLAEKNIQ